jgi:hypothetical protein
VTSDLRRDGGEPCTDSIALSGPGVIELNPGEHRVRTLFGTGGTDSRLDPLRTRCPGPGTADVAGGRLAGGTLPLSAFARRKVTLRLNRGGSYLSDGYRGATSADMTVVLRRVKIRDHLQVIHVPTDTGIEFRRVGR